MPFAMKGQFSTIYKHFDGPLYIIPAKTGYNPQAIKLLDRDASLPHNPIYFAAHLPLYPFFIYMGSFAVGFLKSMLSVTVVTTILLSWFFYYMLKKFSLTRHPLLLSTVFLFLPRFLVIRTIGSPEPLFLLLILVSLFSFEKKNYLLAGLTGALAAMTKTPGIFLFGAYFFCIIERMLKKERWNWNYIYLILIPVGLLSVFGLYYIQYKDFFAYFHTGGTVPMPYPFSVFDASAKWVGTAWLEDAVFYFCLYIATAVALWKSKQRSFFYFTALFIGATLFVQHRDISRYSVPLWPLACIAFEQVLTSKRSIIVGSIMIIGIYMYAWNFIGANVMPITEWLPLL